MFDPYSSQQIYGKHYDVHNNEKIITDLYDMPTETSPFLSRNLKNAFFLHEDLM